MALENLQRALTAIEEEIGAGMLIRARVAGGDISALVAGRVRNEGKAADGASFSPYSENGLQAWKLLGKSRTASAEKKVQELAKKRGHISYREFRELNGLKVDKKNFEFTGEMWRMFNVTEVVLKGNEIEITCAGLTKPAQDKINWGSEKEGKSIVDASEAELALVQAALSDWLQKTIQKHLQ